jgi:anti-anti-sigma factor
MDSSGIGVLLSTADALRQEGGDLRLARAETKMRNLFLMTRLLGEVFTLYPTVEAAVESFAPEPTLA